MVALLPLRSSWKPQLEVWRSHPKGERHQEQNAHENKGFILGFSGHLRGQLRFLGSIL